MSGAVVGVDVGGTFTDLILMEPETGNVRLAKVPSTPANQAAGVLAALDGAAASLADVGAIIHGTTVTTNALLERKLSRCGLITTKGFRDILELGRRTRPPALRPHRQLHAADPARASHRGAGAHGCRWRGAGAAGRSGGARCNLLAPGRRLRLPRDPLPAQLQEPRARGARARDRPRMLARGTRLGGARGPRRVPRVRAGCRGSGKRLRSAASAPLSRPPAGAARRPGLRARAAGDPGQRRQRLGPLGGGEGSQHGALRPGVRRHGGGCHRPRRWCRAADHLRYRRHQRRCGAGARRRAGGHGRDGAGARHAHPRPHGGRAHRGRRWRLAGADRRSRAAPGRAPRARALSRGRSATAGAACGRR